MGTDRNSQGRGTSAPAPEAKLSPASLRLSCECGTTVSASDMRELVARAHAHARREHGMELAIDELIGVAERANTRSRRAATPKQR